MRQFGKQRIGLYLLALVLIIAIPAGVLAQLGDEDEPRPSVPISGDPDMYAEVVDLDEEAGQTDFLLAEAPNTINYQGYLTNASGTPFNGDVTIIADLYNRLSKQYQENIHLAMLDDTDVVFMTIVESLQRVKLAAAVGQRLPAYATASGKSILAFLPEGIVRRILDRGMPRLTPYTHISPGAFLQDLHTIKEQGFALSEQEYEEEINAVAAPIFDLAGQPIASLAVAGPAYRLTRERMVAIGPVVAATTREISQEIRLAAAP